MSDTTAPEGAPGADGATEEVVPDYSRVGFRDLQRLCKARGLPGDGKTPELIERLKAYDVQHGKDVDVTIPEDDDPLGLDEPTDEPDAPESPVDGGEAASAPPSTGTPGVAGLTIPPGGAVTSAAPAIVVVSAPDAPQGLPAATLRGGKPNLAAHDGVVKVGEGHGAAEVRAFRYEIPVGPSDISDANHFAYIAEAHAAAQRAGHVTKGGITVGERVGFGHDADGRRTAIYQVSLKRQK